MSQRFPALIVSADARQSEHLADPLKARGYYTSICSTVKECKRLIEAQEIQVVLCDRELPDGTYQDVLTYVKALGQDLPLIVTSRLGDWSQYFEAVGSGAFDLIPSPCNLDEVLRILSQLPTPEARLANAS
ncbi:MAG: hypothetical protein NVS9B4_11830 [Candidatus Acidiferrum sp.]